MAVFPPTYTHMNRNLFLSPASPDDKLNSLPFEPTSPVSSPEKAEVPFSTAEIETELDFFATLLLDFSKGVLNSSVQDSLLSKRKSDEIDNTSFMTKKTKRMPRSPSINSLIGEQTIACEEHSIKHLRCPMNCPNRRPGSKRTRIIAADESRSGDMENEVEAQSSFSVQVNESTQPTKIFELPKPQEIEDFVQLLNWAFTQLPSQQGTFDEVFSVIRKNGWKELKSGTPRELLVCRKNFLKVIETTFQASVDLKGNFIYSAKELSQELAEEKQMKKAQKKKVKPIIIEPHSPFSSENLSPNTSAPGSPDSTNMFEPSFPNEEYSQEEGLSPNSKSKKGRRWLRFACEKHRKEHTKCGENCPSRRITYTMRANAIESQ